MYQHSCRTAGAVGCGWSTSASSEAELRAKITEHAMRAHGLKGMTDTIYNYLRDTAARGG